MEWYWKARPATTPTTPTEDPNNPVQLNKKSILSEFDRHHLTLLSSQDKDEVCQYLKDLPTDVMKDIDIVKWWQVCVSIVQRQFN
jgi:hypothetical protein